nr:thioredoxin [Bacteroidetes bacterium endosymbiont of Geopemphigus sp.]
MKSIIMAKEVTDKDFESLVLKSDKPVLVDFWAPWCGPCRALSPVIDEISKEYDGKALIVKVNVDDNPETSSTYGIRSIPTLIFFKGGEEKDRKVGAASKKDLKKQLDKLMV